MSAFMVGTDHIDTLLTAGLAEKDNGTLRWEGDGGRGLTDATAGRVGAMLLAENRRSVNYRYDEDDLEQPYVYRRLAQCPPAVVILNAIACLEYQSCEHSTWDTSEARRFLAALERQQIRLLPGYREAKGWDIDAADWGGHAELAERGA
ncbi:MAG: hypothetical protein ACYCTE_08625 [Acidimicrobiales bacterium]